ncbi:restriction endonuclease [Hyphobacterium marinum]|uniref:DEAD/DEAH box helicase family protein n=1 Tax=Hyphobacterium marinum TaxID=3116574 RepID=A0ABU7LXC3_9PROT|nr:DEAD/DEAH box helicase family protein [Hyphobacterium sp. Y6023]MEE2565840.1 DEAD/DEAH box helicase family protein [Hyphobacterium sp. Y6023]
MTQQIFKPLDYQAKATQAVVDCFAGQPRIEGVQYQIDPGQISGMGDAAAQTSLFEEGLRNAPLKLSDADLLENIRKVQMAQHLPPSGELAKSKAAPVNLDVEMETGTGKTYVYIDTMYRLFAEYGWSKFIIIVPSIAIREGVKKTLEDTEGWFHSLYGHKIRHFVYSSSQLNKLTAFSEDGGLHCMIINTQAFTADVRAADTGRGAGRIIFDTPDSFQSRRPIDVIAGNRPILILDEPQRMEGAKTQAAMTHFQSPLALRFSATHKTRYNLVHRLDALDAYNRKLVKKIQVKGVTTKGLPGLDGYLYLSGFRTFTDGRKPEARVMIEHGLKGGQVKRKPVWLRDGDRLEEKSGGLAEYAGYTVSNIDVTQRTVEFTNGELLEEGRVTGDTSENAVRRVQIRETIRAHFDRERLLHARGIKVLSLFFIDEVAKYRIYGEDGEKQNGLYAQMFEEEYQRALNELAELDTTDQAWLAYVKRDRPEQVHDGYFSIDKKGRMVDPSVNKTGDEKGEAKDESSYDLILKNKGRLLSLDEPVRFIFSHSALREGWDNPNVFTICTLKQSDHEIGKRQEVGRGLRISVDANGHRTDDKSIVHQINVLTVIASESYEDFAKALQDEMADALKGRPREATAAYFQTLSITTPTGAHDVTQAQASELEYWLIGERYIDPARHITAKWHEDRDTIAEAIAAGASGKLSEASEEAQAIWENFPYALQEHAAEFVALVDTVFDETALRRMTGNARKMVMPEVRRKNLEKEAFLELWNQINKQAVYFTDFDTESLITRAVARLDKDLSVDRQRIIVTGAELGTGIGVENIRSRSAFREERTRSETYEDAVDSTVRFDLIGQLASLARLTRQTTGRILTGINANTFAMFGQNPEMFLRKVAELIRREKVALAIESLRYEKTGQTYDVSIFETDRQEIPLEDALETSKHVYNYVAVDSKNERDFSSELEAAEEVIVYAKLPRGFTIPTPGGPYNPDWAIALEFAGERQIYFVAETKGDTTKEQLRLAELHNTDSAERYFRDIAPEIQFKKIKDYDELLRAIGQAS